MTPLKHRLSTTMKVCGVIFVWAIAIGISMPYILSQDVQDYNGEKFCLEDINFMTEKQKVIYAISLSVTGWIIPITIVAVLYGLCIQKLRETSFNNDNNDSMKRRLIENRKVIKMFILITILFCLFTLPYATFYSTLTIFLTYKRDGVDFKLIWTLNYSLFAISNINSCINPFVYAKRQPKMKAFVKMALNRLFCKSVDKNSQSARMKKYGVGSQQSSKTTTTSTLKHATSISFQNKAFDSINDVN